MGYQLKAEYKGKGLVTTFSKPLPEIGFTIEWDKATPKQVEAAYLFTGGMEMIEKTEDKK